MDWWSEGVHTCIQVVMHQFPGFCARLLHARNSIMHVLAWDITCCRWILRRRQMRSATHTHTLLDHCCPILHAWNCCCWWQCRVVKVNAKASASLFKAQDPLMSKECQTICLQLCCLQLCTSAGTSNAPQDIPCGQQCRLTCKMHYQQCVESSCSFVFTCRQDHASSGAAIRSEATEADVCLCTVMTCGICLTATPWNTLPMTIMAMVCEAARMMAAIINRIPLYLQNFSQHQSLALPSAWESHAVCSLYRRPQWAENAGCPCCSALPQDICWENSMCLQEWSRYGRILLCSQNSWQYTMSKLTMSTVHICRVKLCLVPAERIQAAAKEVKQVH